MFIDTSVVVAILSDEDDARHWAGRLEAAPVCMTTALVVLEAAMRLSTKLAVEPMEVAATIDAFFREAGIKVSPIDANDGEVAVRAFAKYGKGRGHPAQLNLADCLSYACAKNRKLSLLFKGDDFSRTDIARSP